MKKEVVEKWVAALRSGKYKQGRSVLRDFDNRYCCLGVLCEISNISPHREEGQVFYRYGQHVSIIGSEFKDITTLCTSEGWIPSISTSLATLNDHGLSFTKLADIIEKHYAEL